MRPVVVVGDAVLDRDVVGAASRLAPDAPVPVLDEQTTSVRPGGAALAAALVAAQGREVVLVAALGDDPAGDELRAALDCAGVELVDLRLDGPTPEKIRLRAGGTPLVRLDRGGGPHPVGTPDRRTLDAVAGAAAVLVADYGRGVAASPLVRGALEDLDARRALVWDPHPRGAPPVGGAHLATPNRAEVGALGGAPTTTLAEVATAAGELARRWRARSVAVTLGAAGALLIERGAPGPPLVIPSLRVPGADACGAGDCFAAAAVGAMAEGALASEAAVAAVAGATAFVAAGGASGFGVVPPARPPVDADAASLAAHLRATGATVVATGGCFDLLHAGHLALLRAARALGDCLVVCLNSDESVRRLKGPGRPLTPAAERAEILGALECVDAVAVFDEDTPAEVLRRLRPHLFVKGADYAGVALAEESVLGEWGGQVVMVPYLDGRSTSRLMTRLADARS